MAQEFWNDPLIEELLKPEESTHMTYTEAKAWATTLDPVQLRVAWERMQDIYEEEDIRNELDCAWDFYAERYDIDEHPVTDVELSDMVVAFDTLWNSEDYRYSDARETAVCRVLDRRKEAHT